MINGTGFQMLLFRLLLKSNEEVEEVILYPLL